MTTGFDVDVRLALYHEFVQIGRAPSVYRIAEMLKAPQKDVEAALDRLAAGKAIVLQPESRAVLMANPLCAVPSPFLARVGGQSFFGSCAWDALGIIAMLQQDGSLDSSCACCGEAMTITVHDGQPLATDGVIHFAIPAKQWWENIVFT